MTVKKEWVVLDKIKKVEATDIIEKILRLRGIKNLVHFLKPVPSDLLPLTDLPNIEKAGEVVLKAVKEGKRIHIFCDCDADGVSSGAIIYNYLKVFTTHITWSINKGKKHGLKFQDLKSYVGQYDLVIVVDSSSTQIEEQKFLKDNGIDVVILDHHPVQQTKFATIVNCTNGGYKNPFLSGSAVAFKFVKYLDLLQNTQLADLFWDLAVVGLIGDGMPVGEDNTENRYICSKGFEKVNNIGLKKVIGNYSFNGTSISYSVAPLVNAAQRLSQNGLAFELFIEDDEDNCRKIIRKLKELKEIQDIEKEYLVNKLSIKIKSEELDKQKMIGIILEDPPKADITGLVANVIGSNYNLPTIMVHPTEEEGILRGSIRGFGIDNFRDLIKKVDLVNFVEGHEQAAGIELLRNNWDKLIEALNNELANVELKNVTYADIELKPEQITYDLIKKMEYINIITGEGFKPINVVIRDMEINDLGTMKDKHIKFFSDGIQFLKWNSIREFGDYKVYTPGIYRCCDVVGVLGVNNFRGKKSKQLIIDDTTNFEDKLEFMRE